MSRERNCFFLYSQSLRKLTAGFRNPAPVRNASMLFVHPGAKYFLYPFI
jgi:hypothetical protein